MSRVKADGARSAVDWPAWPSAPPHVRCVSNSGLDSYTLHRTVPVFGLQRTDDSKAEDQDESDGSGHLRLSRGHGTPGYRQARDRRRPGAAPRPRGRGQPGRLGDHERPALHRPPGLWAAKPKVGVRGTDVAGVVEAIGANVTRFKPGDEVFGSANGSYAEYAAASEDSSRSSPPTSRSRRRRPCRWPATSPSRRFAITATSRPGQKVLINGASGGIGTFAVQIAKAARRRGHRVASTRNVELVRSIGADRRHRLHQGRLHADGKQYDFILDNVSNHSLADLRRALTPTGHARAERRQLRQPLVRQRRSHDRRAR